MTEPAAAPPPRYHALDSLRAFCMLLGILLHASISYMDKCPPWWPADGEFRSPGFDAAVFIIHAFRMETFFVMAGFFARLIHLKYGAAGFAANRGLRVALPLVLGCAVLVPIFLVLNPFNRPLEQVLAVVPYHLWFLYYLLFFYAAVLIACGVFGAMPGGEGGGVDRLMARLADSWAAPLLFAVPTAAVLMAMKTYLVDTPLGPVPQPPLLLHYGLFFLFGWLLHRQPALLSVLAGRWKWWLAVGLLVALPAAVTAVGAAMGDNIPGKPIPPDKLASPGVALAARAALALLIWLLVLGTTGAFVALMNRDRPAIRWLADSAYWLYIAHLPLVVWLQMLLRDSTVPGPLRFPLVVAGSLAVLLPSYQLLVRHTIVGVMLNGRRPADALRPPAAK